MSKTVKRSAAPGCLGSPTIRAMNHPLCGECPFRTICGKLVIVNERRLEEDMGIGRIERREKQPGRKSDNIAKPAAQPCVGTLGPGALALKKELISCGYDKWGLNDLIKSGGAAKTRGITWLSYAIEVVARGGTVDDMRRAIVESGVGRMQGYAKSQQLLNVLLHYGIVRHENETGKIIPETEEIA